jgi:hypothetical protein
VHHLLSVPALRADTHGDLMSVREAVAAETAATNTAVAAAATAAAAEAAADSKAATAHEAATKAAAAANERRALDVRTPSNKPDLPKKMAAARNSWAVRTFPGGGVWSGGPGPRPRGDGASVVAAPRHGLRRGHRDGLRPFHVQVHGLRCGLLVALRECHGAGVRVLT